MMKVKLLRDARIMHKAGEILEVSPAECDFLIATDGAMKVDAVETIETPEDKANDIETPEDKKKASPRKTTKKK